MPLPTPPADAWGLSRFLEAQAVSYGAALAELRAGRKKSHWIWYVFPQLAGLGRSPLSRRYGICGLAQARAYLAHPVLGERLREAVRAMLAHRTASVAHILGDLDALKFRSCLTLFAQADPAQPLFLQALEVFFAGQPDGQTLQLLARSGGDGAGGA